MASSQRMMLIGIVWVFGTILLALLTIIGGMLIQYVSDLVLSTPINSLLTESLGGIWYIPPLYYTFILVAWLVLTWRCIQETAVVTDYYPDVGVI